MDFADPFSSLSYFVSKSGTVEMGFFGGKSYQTELCHKSLGPEITVRGGFSEKTPMVETLFNDGVRSIELQFVDAELREIDKYSTLVIHQRDKYYPLNITEYFRVLPEYDIIENGLKLRILVEKLL